MKTMKFILTISAFVLITLLLVSCQGQSAEDETHEIPPVPVMVDTPEIGSITEWYKTTCELRSPMEATLSFTTGGRILDLAVDEGALVVEGQYLGKVDTSALSAQYSAAHQSAVSAEERAEAARLAAEATDIQVIQAGGALAKQELDYNRYAALYEDGIATESEYENKFLAYENARLNQQAAEDVAEAAWAQARAAETGVGAAYSQAAQIAEIIDDGTLRAPFAGRIADRFSEPGDVTAPGLPVFRLIGEGDSVQNQMEVVMDIPESVIGRIAVGSTLYIDLLSCDRTVNAAIDRIGPEVRGGSRTVEALAYIPMDSLCLLPGMFGTVRTPLETHDNAILVPENAVIVLEDVSLIYIAEGNTAGRREVQTGLHVEGIVEILDGINATDSIIVVGNSFLIDGASIEIRDRSDSSVPTDEPVMEGED